MGGETDASVFGVSVGPGDPDLITLRALEVIGRCPVVAYACNTRGESRALAVVHHRLREDHVRLALPMSFGDATPTQRLQDYEHAASVIAQRLTSGASVAVLCLGDASLYGSFGGIAQRLRGRWRCTWVPGVTAMSAAAAVAETSLVRGRERLTIAPGGPNDPSIDELLTHSHAAAVFKPSRSLEAMRRELQASAGGQAVGWVVRQAVGETMTCHDCFDDASMGYFSMLLAKRRVP